MRAEGPYFDELTAGQAFPAVAGVTLTDGLAAAHQAIVGDRLALSLDAALADVVLGSPGPGRPANPALVWDVAIGQSTVATQHVKANLFYRGLWFRRLPVIGDTLRTVTRAEGLRQNRPRVGRGATGLAALRITTVDQHDRPVLDFWRCAMLPLRDPAGTTGHADDLDAIGASAQPAAPAALLDGWRLDRFAAYGFWPRYGDLVPGDVIEIDGGDVVSGAPELARLTLNIARVHHDEQAAGGTRLVYGGHTIGIALSQAARSGSLVNRSHTPGGRRGRAAFARLFGVRAGPGLAVRRGPGLAAGRERIAARRCVSNVWAARSAGCAPPVTDAVWAGEGRPPRRGFRLEA